MYYERLLLSGPDEISTQDTSTLTRFLEKNCEKNLTSEKDKYGWKFTLTDDKLGNSIFLFYEMDWDKAMVLLKRGTVNLLIQGRDR